MLYEVITPREILPNSLPNEFATDLPSEVFPVPGGPTKHKTGDFFNVSNCLTAIKSRILSYNFV